MQGPPKHADIALALESHAKGFPESSVGKRVTFQSEAAQLPMQGPEKSGLFVNNLGDGVERLRCNSPENDGAEPGTEFT